MSSPKDKEMKETQNGGYCMKCGNKLVKVGYTEEFSFYDSTTGKRDEPLELWKCPNKKWYNAGHELLARRATELTGNGILIL